MTPADVLANRDLSARAKVVFAVLVHNAWDQRTDETWIFNADIATRAGIPVSAVTKALNELEDAGLIARQHNETTIRLIHVLHLPTPHEIEDS